MNHAQKQLLLPGGCKRLAGLVLILSFDVFTTWVIYTWSSGRDAIAWACIMLLLTLPMLAFADTVISAESGRVVQLWRLLGIWTVWRQEYPLGSFTGIQQRYFRGAEDSAWQVGLRSSLGRFLPVQVFFAGSEQSRCPEADSYARELAELTGLQLLETDVQPRLQRL